MARAMTAAREIRNPAPNRSEETVAAKQRGPAVNLPILLAKNLLFWGSISLSLFGIYSLISLL